MPDFNKGDKTQQGMSAGGWDWGQLDFSKKRQVFVAVTSNEEEEGLDGVFLNVHDGINNLDYAITGVSIPVGQSTVGITPEGTITITENGEGIDIAQYRYADVSVSGDGDFTTAEVIVISGDGTTNNLMLPIIYDNEEYSICTVANNLGGTTTTYSVPLYKGEADAILGDGTPTITVTGSAEYVSADGYIAITGDCTITLS